MKVNILRWHYSESGHGKGAPHGIGGCLKRTADNLVGQGKDIQNFDVLFEQLRENCKEIKCNAISSSDISEKDCLLPVHLKPLKGTMAIHELVWKRDNENVLQA